MKSGSAPALHGYGHSQSKSGDLLGLQGISDGLRIPAERRR